MIIIDKCHKLLAMVSEGKAIAGGKDDPRQACWDDWAAEDPEHLGSMPQPKFPTELLPEWGRVQVEAVSEATETPTDLGGMVFLAILSLVFAKRVRVLWSANLIEQVVLYVLIAMASGSGKSAGFKLMMEPVYEAQAEKQRDMGPQLSRLSSKRAGLKVAIKRLHGKSAEKANDLAEFQKLQRRAGELQSELDALDRPVKKLYVLEEGTSEAVTLALRDQGEKLGLFSDEAGEQLGIFSGATYSGTANVGVVLNAYNGTPYTSHRIGRDPVQLNGPLMPIGWTVQPSVLEEMVRNPTFKGRGMLGRFLYSDPASLVGNRNFIRPAIPDSIKQTYSAIIKAQLADKAEMTMTVSPKANSHLNQLWSLTEDELNPVSGSLAHMGEWGNRICGTAVRIAALLSCADKWRPVIEEEAMQRSVKLTRDYLLPHAKRVHAVMCIDERTTAARELLAYILAKQWQRFDGTTLHQAVRGRKKFKLKADVEETLATLERARWVKPLLDPRDVWDVHPRAELFKDV